MRIIYNVTVVFCFCFFYMCMYVSYISLAVYYWFAIDVDVDILNLRLSTLYIVYMIYLMPGSQALSCHTFVSSTRPGSNLWIGAVWKLPDQMERLPLKQCFRFHDSCIYIYSYYLLFSFIPETVIWQWTCLSTCIIFWIPSRRQPRKSCQPCHVPGKEFTPLKKAYNVSAQKGMCHPSLNQAVEWKEMSYIFHVFVQSCSWFIWQILGTPAKNWPELRRISHLIQFIHYLCWRSMSNGLRVDSIKLMVGWFHGLLAAFLENQVPKVQGHKSRKRNGQGINICCWWYLTWTFGEVMQAESFMFVILKLLKVVHSEGNPIKHG